MVKHKLKADVIEPDNFGPLIFFLIATCHITVKVQLHRKLFGTVKSKQTCYTTTTITTTHNNKMHTNVQGMHKQQQRQRLPPLSNGNYKTFEQIKGNR